MNQPTVYELVGFGGRKEGPGEAIAERLGVLAGAEAEVNRALPQFVESTVAQVAIAGEVLQD